MAFFDLIAAMPPQTPARLPHEQDEAARLACQPAPPPQAKRPPADDGSQP
ncbi:MAG: hypothetical protein IRY89_06065 [Pseudolabrys sp.]|nr:hypothetical protein [Pseudolabrys sp.]